MIHILEKHVADKIAAGEVIDRPVSIIKELLENALDAGASQITVEIRNGGKSYLRVTDNGCGILPEDVEVAFQRHATSKITTAGDLDAVETLGFRGEALASICAVSRVELITKTEQSKTGRRIVVEGSQVLQNEPTGCPQGTTVTVHDLFYNTPARRKFLGTDNSEARRIIDMVSRIALAYGDVKFNLLNGKKRVFSTHGKGNIRNSIISIYGADTGKDLLPVELRRGDLLLKGFVSGPGTSAASRNRQIFCVNGRVVSSKVLETALESAYREKLFAGRFPIAFLFMAISPGRLDVNIHPTKKEIRFDDNHEVEDFVRDAVMQALQTKDALPQIRAEHLKSSQAPEPEGDVEGKKPAEKAYEFQEMPKKAVDRTERDTVIPVKQVKQVEEEQVDIKKLLNTLPRTQKNPNDPKDSKEEFEKNEQQEQMTMEKYAQTSEAVSKPESCSLDQHHPDSDFHEKIDPSGKVSLPIKSAASKPFDIASLHWIGAIFNTYILATDDTAFYLIDQHAAHERIFYEKLLKEYNDAQKMQQQLLVPLQFKVSPQVEAFEDEWIGQVRDLGYHIENFGKHIYLVREIPAFMELDEAESFLADVLQALEGRPDLTNHRVLERIIMKSCKSAVKGGDHLEAPEIDALMKDLRQCVNPFSCPHGRPTFIRITRYEIEKMFKRV